VLRFIERTFVDVSGFYPAAIEQYTVCIKLNPNDAKVG